MRHSGFSLLRDYRVIPALVMMAGSLAFAAACSDSGGGGGGGGGGNQTTFLGIISSDDGLSSGAITITLATASPDIEGPTAVRAFATVNASGTHKLFGTAVAVSGSYDDQSKIVSLNGGGYNLVGGYDPATDQLQGIFDGPGVQGVFVTGQQVAGSTAYCGTFTGSYDGTFSFVIVGNTVLGTAYSSSSGSTPIPVEGVLNGTSITIDNPQGGTLATGTISGTSASGTWDDGQGSSGTWSGSVCQ